MIKKSRYFVSFEPLFLFRSLMCGPCVQRFFGDNRARSTGERCTECKTSKIVFQRCDAVDLGWNAVLYSDGSIGWREEEEKLIFSENQEEMTTESR